MVTTGDPGFDDRPATATASGAAADAAAAFGSAGRARPREPKPRWYRRVAPAVLQLDCGGARHTVRWHRGRLVLLDHDVAAEIGLMALGGERPACLALLERWRVTLGTTGGAPGASHRPTVMRSARTPLVSAMSAGQDLRSFGAELGRVVELSWLVRAERRWADPDLAAHDRQRLVDTFLERLRGSFVASLAPSAAVRGRQQLALHARPLPSGEEASAEVTIGVTRIEAELHLPLSWVLDVAGRGLDEVPGRMVLAVIDTDPQRALLGVSGIVWDATGPGQVAARLERWWMQRGEGGWSVTEHERPVRRGSSLWWSTSRR